MKLAKGNKWRALNQSPVIASGSTGAASELMVALDLLTRGFDVFRSVSPSCPCDLIALRNRRQYRVEVKTGSYSISGGILFPKPKDPERYDVLAVVLLRERKIIYRPEFPD